MWICLVYVNGNQSSLYACKEPYIAILYSMYHAEDMACSSATPKVVEPAVERCRPTDCCTIMLLCQSKLQTTSSKFGRQQRLNGDTDKKVELASSPSVIQGSGCRARDGVGLLQF
jgi:hypothetical protein